VLTQSTGEAKRILVQRAEKPASPALGSAGGPPAAVEVSLATIDVHKKKRRPEA
jgi:hypothetical protein